MALSKTVIFDVRRSEPELVRALTRNPTSKNYEIKHLSDIDDQEGLRFLVPIIFFYPSCQSSTASDPVQTIRDALAKALETYYPLAGRVFEGPNRKLMIHCNNEGALFVRAEAHVKLEQLGDGLRPPFHFFEKLLADVPGSGAIIGTPILYLQVTRFICGGFSLGILLNHTVADGAGLKQFLEAVGELAKGAAAPSVPPVWSREVLNARSPPEITYVHHEFDRTLSSTDHPRNLVYPYDTFVLTSVFFGQKEIRALSNQLLQKSPISSFDMITACLWKCRTIALEPHPEDTVLISILTNVRHPRFGLSIPRGYYGNAFAYPAAISKANILCTSPLSYGVELIRKTKLELSKEYVKSVADLLVIKGRPKYVDMWNYIVSDLRRLEMDKVDLGWGNARFGGIPWATPTISFYSSYRENGEGEGVVVPISLPAMAMEKFQYEMKKMTRESISKV
ncbi:methanol O-anthraniloyltransferase-like [Andrographis paniculata]|uniref:methanol O-anthraniloyltransferase-like n=1 Tax=Andrographis paniculata TaxID=175694 RepID=UPI0021E86782|nr:methanol O-anthraniloyltransferase-like [Andrographis paniculata]